jgi:5-methylcytosine-specific restriction endonuclease McrA
LSVELDPRYQEALATSIRIEEMRALPYRDYLKTTWWKRQREGALERARHACQLCNAPERLQVHHRTYEWLGWEEESDLIVLCSSCHSLFHGNRRLAARV